MAARQDQEPQKPVVSGRDFRYLYARLHPVIRQGGRPDIVPQVSLTLLRVWWRVVTKSQNRLSPPPLETAKSGAAGLTTDRFQRVPPLAWPAEDAAVSYLRLRAELGGPLVIAPGLPPHAAQPPQAPRLGAFFSLLLHALVLALLLLSVKLTPPLPVPTPPASIAVILENGGQFQTAAPKTKRHGPPQKARAPRPKPQAAPTSPPDVHLNLAPQQMPPTLAFKAPAPVPPAPRRAAPHYLVMNNRQFYGPSARPEPQTPARPPTMNLQLSQAELAKLQAPEFTIKGKVGADWKAAFTHWVNERKYYPRAAIEMGQQGIATIHLVIHPDGSVSGLRLLKSSGSAFLDEAWLGLFRNARVPPFPPGTKAKQVEIVASMHYELIR